MRVPLLVQSEPAPVTSTLLLEEVGEADGADDTRHRAAVGDDQAVAAAVEADIERGRCWSRVDPAPVTSTLLLEELWCRSRRSERIGHRCRRCDHQAVAAAGEADDHAVGKVVPAAIGDEGGAAAGVADLEVGSVVHRGAFGDDRAAVEGDHAVGAVGGEQLPSPSPCRRSHSACRSRLCRCRSGHWSR